MKHGKVCRPLALLLVSLLVAGLCLSGVAVAQPPTFVDVQPVTQRVLLGETFSVNVVVAPPPGTSVASAQCKIVFDPSVLRAISVTEGDFFSQACPLTSFNGGTIDNTLGTITGIHGASITPGCSASALGTLATVSFTAKQRGSSDIDLHGVIVLDPLGGWVPVEVGGGHVDVLLQPSIPAVSLWGTAGLAVVLGALLAWSVRRRRLARSGMR